MKTAYFKTKNGFEYQYLPRYKGIVYNDTSLSEKPYYKQRERFFRENGLLDSYRPSLVTDYDPQAIKSNLANLRLLVFEVTDSCNLACKYCGYGDLYANYDRRSDKKIDFSEIKILIDYLYNLWLSPLNVSYNNTVTLSFYGGEPLLAFDMIRKTIEYAESLDLKAINFAYNMTTNAMLLDKYMDYLVEKQFSLLISLDGNRLHNSYRVTKNGKESFDSIVKNMKSLQAKYPAYFMEKVNFNSVLHNRNSDEEIIAFIRSEFGKVPRISSVNSVGRDESKIEEFNQLYRNRNFSNFTRGDNSIDEELLAVSPDYTLLSLFYDAFLSNSYDSYAELFINSADQEFIPTGTCHPFSRKLFLTVNGKVLPCERIGQDESLGYIKDGHVNIDFDYIVRLYADKYNRIRNQCSNCINWNNCSFCIFLVKEKNGKLICERFRPESTTSSCCSEQLSLLESKSLIFRELTKRISKI